MQTVYFMKQYNKKITVKYAWTEKDTRMHFLFNLMKLHLSLPQLPAQVKNICSILKVMEGFYHKLMVIIWCLIPGNFKCWNGTTVTKT